MAGTGDIREETGGRAGAGTAARGGSGPAAGTGASTPGGRAAAGPHAPGRRAARAALVWALLACALLGLFLASLACGSVATGPGEVVAALASGPDGSVAATVLWQIRLPRALSAALLGGALALSGYLLQTFFANPIADPFVLGVSSGARLSVALVMVAALGGGRVLGAWESVGAALAGSFATMAVVLALATRVRSQATLIVAGLMVGYVCSAATSFLVAFADEQSIVDLHTWSEGSFSGAAWPDLAAIAPVALAGTAATLALSKQLAAYQLGETFARGVGVGVRGLRLAIVGVSGVLSALVAAFAGPVSFVGIAAPHLARLAVGSSRPGLVIPTCLLAGSVFCCGCDLVARTLFSPVELPVSAVTAVMGAPVVVGLMLRRRSR